MRMARFGRTEAQVSAVALGTWAHGGPRFVGGKAIGWFGTNDRLVHMSLVKAHELGINHWDTADVYGDGHAESLIGQLWGQVPRSEIFLASKVGWDPGPFGHFYHPQQIRRQLERSLRLLATDYLDLFYLHHCEFGPDDAYLDDALAALERFREEGKIRFIGLSDWKAEKLLRFAKRVRPDAVQVYRNVSDDRYIESGLAEWVAANDVGVAFFSPLRHGLLLGLFEGPVTFGAGDHRNDIPDFRDVALLQRLSACRAKLAARFAGKTEPVIHGLVGALLAGAPTGSVLLGQHRPSQVVAAASTGEALSEDDAAWVRGLYGENGRAVRAGWRAQTTE